MRIWETLWPSSMEALSWCTASRLTGRWLRWPITGETFTRPYTDTTAMHSQVNQMKGYSHTIKQTEVYVSGQLGHGGWVSGYMTYGKVVGQVLS